MHQGYTLPDQTYQAFPTPADLDDWLRLNHASATELWVRIYKKASGQTSITWDQCVVGVITWGWIDGQKQKLDDVSYLQRITPRRPRSNWSKRNVDHAERLIASGKMQPSGLKHVVAAKEDGRWAKAYAGQADMVLPDDFLAELAKDPTAKAYFDTLTRSRKFAIYHRLNSAKREETRQKRMADFLDKLSRQADIS